MSLVASEGTLRLETANRIETKPDLRQGLREIRSPVRRTALY